VPGPSVVARQRPVPQYAYVTVVTKLGQQIVHQGYTTYSAWHTLNANGPTGAATREAPTMTQIEARSDVRLTAPTRDGNGWSRTWTRVMYGVLWSFTAVVMPITGELRYTVSRYTKEINDLPRFGCDWRREHSITVKAEAHGALTFKRTRPGLYTGSAAGEARYDVIRDPHRGRDNQWCVRVHGSTDTLSAHRLLKSAQRAAASYYGKSNAGALIERLAVESDAVYGECTGARDEQTLGRPRAHAGTVGTYRFTSGAADARLCTAHGDAYGDLATRVDDEPPAAAEPTTHYTRDGATAGCGDMFSNDKLTSTEERVNCDRCRARMAAARDVRRGNTDDLTERAGEQGFELVVTSGRMPIELRSGGLVRMNFADRDTCRQWLAAGAVENARRHNQLADEITEFRVKAGSWPTLDHLIAGGWAVDIVLGAVDARVIEQHERRYLTTPAGYVAAFYREHRGWPSLSQIVQRGADLDVVHLAIEAGRLEHREIGDVRMLMLPVPNPDQPLAINDVVTVMPDRQSRQFDVIELDQVDGMVRVAPRTVLHVEDGPRWLGPDYVQRVPAVLVLPGDGDDEQGDGDQGGDDPQPTGPAPLAPGERCTEATAGTGATVHVVVDGAGLVTDGHDVDQCPAGASCSGAAFPGHPAHDPTPVQQQLAALGTDQPADALHMTVTPSGARKIAATVAARAADRAGRAYAELLMSHAEATRTSNTERAAMLADSLPLIRQAAIEAGADVPAIERQHGPGPVEPTVRARCWHGSTVDMRPLGWWHRGPGTRCDDPGPLVDELYGRTEVVVDRPNGGTLTYYVGQRVTLTGSSGVFVIESFETRGGVTPAPYAVLVGDGVPAARAGAYVSYLVPAPAIEIVERPKFDAGDLVAARCTAGDYQSSPMTEARARRAGDAHLLDKHGIGEPTRTVADMLMPAMPAEYRRVLTHLLTPFGYAAPDGIDKLVPSDANPEAFLVHDPTGIAVGVHDRFVRLSYPAEHAGEGAGDVGEAFVDLAYGTSFETVADLAIGLTQRLMRTSHLNHMRDVADDLRRLAGMYQVTGPHGRECPCDGCTHKRRNGDHPQQVTIWREELGDLADRLAGVDTECRAAGYARRATAVVTGIMVKLVALGERGGHVDPELLRSLALVAAEAMTAPEPDVEQLVEHIKKGADAAIVADETLTPADVDALIDTLVGAGWELAGEPEFVLGKRVRYLVPPTAIAAGVATGADDLPADLLRLRAGADLPAAAERHQAPEGVPFVMCTLHGADCRSAQNGRPCSGMPSADELLGKLVALTGCEREGGTVVDVTDSGRSVHVDTGEGITVADRGSVTVVDPQPADDDQLGDTEGEVVDGAGYLACGCHGSQRDHTCTLYAEGAGEVDREV
jgi:hypothetical protein